MLIKRLHSNLPVPRYALGPLENEAPIFQPNCRGRNGVATGSAGNGREALSDCNRSVVWGECHVNCPRFTIRTSTGKGYEYL